MKDKKYLVIFLLLIIAGLFIFRYKNNNKVEVKLVETNKSEILTPTPKIEPIVFTQEQLSEYYQTTKSPYVLHIRKVLNGYLNGTNIGMDLPKSVIEKHEISGEITGLSAFDKEYYKSKFIVFAVNPFTGGGEQISIIFQDKPDKLFNVWVYKFAGNGGYDLRSFWQVSSFTEEVMKEIQIKYKTILEDVNHSI